MLTTYLFVREVLALAAMPITAAAECSRSTAAAAVRLVCSVTAALALQTAALLTSAIRTANPAVALAVD